MRKAQHIKSDLKSSLAEIADEELNNMNFIRKKDSLLYERHCKGCEQIIHFGFDALPRYSPDHEIHIHPSMQIGMEDLSRTALLLVGGDRMLLADAPEILVNQPIEFCAPKNVNIHWYATGLDEIKKCISDILVFLKEWVFPFLDSVQTVDDLIKIYENNDSRMLKQKHWYLYIIAAELNRSNPKAALNVLEKHFSGMGPKRRYSKAFEFVNSSIENSNER